MARLGCLTSILLDIIAIGALLFFVAAPENVKENPDVISFKNSLFCNPGEEYVEVLGPYTYSSSTSSSGRSFNAYCENSEGQEREVTARSFGIMAASFAVPLIVGIFMTIFSVGAMTRSVQRRVVQQIIPTGAGGTISIKQQGYPADISVTSLNGGDITTPQDAAKLVQDILNGFTSDTAHVFTNMQSMTAKGDLKSRLQQLEEAKNANLISQSEYDRIRQQILDSMDD